MYVRREFFDPQHHPAVDNKCFDAWISLLPQSHRDWKAPLAALPEHLPASRIEYVYLQNPLAQFDERRPRLPNQLYPGLGVGKEFLAMLKVAAQQHDRELLVNKPESFHNALIYHLQGMRYVAPHFQAFLEILLEDLGGDIATNMATVAWAVHEGRLRFHGTCVMHWPLWDQVLPISERVIAFVHSSAPLITELKKMSPRPLFSIVADE